MLFPDDVFKRIWDFMIAILLLYTLIMSPIMIAFDYEDLEIGLMVCDTIVDVIFLADVILTFFTAYYD